MVLDQNLDTENYRNINSQRAREVVLRILEENEYIDGWRVLNENKRSFTWRRLNPVRKEAKLDFLSLVKIFFTLLQTLVLYKDKGHIILASH